MRGNVTPAVSALGFVVVGVALRVVAYGGDTSLWLDEILVARSILDLPAGPLLFDPLPLDQVAPRGFLLAARGSVVAFGPNEHALRLVPFLAGLAALWLFHRLAARTLAPVGATIAVALFAIGVPFIKFAADVKQYEGDIAVALALLLMALVLRDRPQSTNRLAAGGVFGFVAVAFSQAAVLVMAGIGAALAVEWWSRRDQGLRRVLLVTMPLWALASLLGVAIGMRSMTPATQAFMKAFWAAGFMPWTSVSAAAQWTWTSLVLLFSDVTLLRYDWPAVYVVLALAGTAVLWRTSRSTALVLTGPLLVAVAAAAAHQYPLRGRLVVWLLPGLLIAVAAAIDRLRTSVSRLHPIAGHGAVAALLVVPVMAIVAAPPPYEIEHNRSMAEYLAAHRQAGDRIHVFPLSRVGLRFYGPAAGLPSGAWRTADCRDPDTRAYLRDVDRYRGSPRVWLLTNGARPFRVARATVRQYLETIGTRIDSVSRPSLTMGMIALELFDLSDPTRLAAADVETFPAPPAPTDPPPACRAFARADAEDAPAPR